jgi:Zn-dependent protease
MSFNIAEWIIKIPVLLFAITIHEYAHGRVAFAQGDPTAKNMGRLTLNPLPHIDPFGAICLFLFNFGWAKPVPIEPRYFRNIKQGIILVSFSGPLANISTAFVAGMFIRLFSPNGFFLLLLFYFLLMNLGLGLFNLIPIPPLDGSHILESLLPPKAALSFQQFGRYGPIFLIAIILLDNYAHTGIFSRILMGPIKFLFHLFSGL